MVCVPVLKGGNCLERVMQKLMEHLGIPSPWHPDQPHLAEWQAYSTREILFNIDQSVEARNMAKKQAAKHKGMLAKDGEEDADTMPKARIVIEDLGGAPADLDDEAHPEDVTAPKHELEMTTSIIQRVLSRTTEREAAGNVGRPKDMDKDFVGRENVVGVPNPNQEIVGPDETIKCPQRFQGQLSTRRCNVSLRSLPQNLTMSSNRSTSNGRTIKP